MGYYDCYRNFHRDRKGLGFRRDIKQMVLKDLDKVSDLIEKLEILDSFEAFVERVHTEGQADWISEQAGQIFARVLKPFVSEMLPGVMPMARSRATEVKPTQ